MIPKLNASELFNKRIRRSKRMMSSLDRRQRKRVIRILKVNHLHFCKDDPKMFDMTHLYLKAIRHE